MADLFDDLEAVASCATSTDVNRSEPSENTSGRPKGLTFEVQTSEADQELADWINSQPPLDDDEMEARFSGEERAGIPSWSASAVRLGVAWRALLASKTPERAAELERVEEDAYRAARRRKVAQRAMDAENLD